jgi:mutator protein MutT
VRRSPNSLASLALGGDNGRVERARRHVLFLLTGEVAVRLQALRSEWDPVMAARIPPHVSLVYPEETVDEPLLLDRVTRAAAETAPFVISLADLESSDTGGVWFPVSDPSDGWATLRSTILAPPFRPLPVEPHATVVHPRTSDRGKEATTELAGTRIDGSVHLGEMLFTETSKKGMHTLDRFPLTGQRPVQIVAGLLRRDGRVLLCHRNSSRANYPDVWDLPGGHVDAGETIADALARELAEELGIVVEPPTDPAWMTLAADGLELSVFLVDTWEGEPHNASPDEHDDIRWVRMNDLADLDLADSSYEEMLRRSLS